MGKYVFERHFDGTYQKNAILAPFIDCHDPGRTVSRELNIHSGSFNNAEQFSINVSFNTFYSKAKSRKNNTFLTSLRHMHFCGMTARFLSCHWVFIGLYSVLQQTMKVLISLLVVCTVLFVFAFFLR